MTSAEDVTYSSDSVCLSVCVQNISKSNEGILMKFCGEVERAPGGTSYILVAIQFLSWILDHFQDSVPLADGAQTDILQCISASYERILMNVFGGVRVG